MIAKNKLGFVTGKCVKPAETDPEYLNWQRCYNIVISWLLHSVERKLLVVYFIVRVLKTYGRILRIGMEFQMLLDFIKFRKSCVLYRKGMIL